MKSFTIALFIVVLCLAGFSRASYAQEKSDSLRQQLIQEIDRRLQQLRQELIARIDQKLARAERNYLGLLVKPLPPGLRILLNIPEKRGILVAGVIPDGPALHAGLQPLDIVVSFAGQTIRTPEEFHQQTQATEAGKPIELIVWRRGKKLVLSVVAVKKSEDFIERTEKDYRQPLRELLDSFSTLQKKINKIETKTKELVEKLQDPENIELLQQLLQQGEQYLRQLKNDPAMSAKLKDRLRILARKLKEMSQRQKLPAQLQRLLDELLKFERPTLPPSQPRQQALKEIDNLLDDLLGESPVKAGKPWLGLEVRLVPDILRERENIPEKQGVLVAQVSEQGPACQAGIARWDILLAIDDNIIHSPVMLPKILQTYKPGDRICLTILSQGLRKKITVVLQTKTR